MQTVSETGSFDFVPNEVKAQGPCFESQHWWSIGAGHINCLHPDKLLGGTHIQVARHRVDDTPSQEMSICLNGPMTLARMADVQFGLMGPVHVHVLLVTPNYRYIAVDILVLTSMHTHT